jgi:cation transport protein ChaC
VKAETYVADRGHHQYAGKQTLERAAALIAQGAGTGGSNRDYLESTVDHLDALGITDGPLHRLHAMVRGIEVG